MSCNKSVLAGDQYFDTPYFTLEHVERAVALMKKSGCYPELAKFYFGQRVDLEGNPFTLSFTVEREEG